MKIDGIGANKDSLITIWDLFSYKNEVAEIIIDNKLITITEKKLISGHIYYIYNSLRTCEPSIPTSNISKFNALCWIFSNHWIKALPIKTFRIERTRKISKGIVTHNYSLISVGIG